MSRHWRGYTRLVRCESWDDILLKHAALGMGISNRNCAKRGQEAHTFDTHIAAIVEVNWQCSHANSFQVNVARPRAWQRFQVGAYGPAKKSHCFKGESPSHLA